MKNETENSRKPAEKKSPQMGGNVVWYLLALCLGALLLFGMLTPKPGVEIPISRLYELLEKRNPAEEKHKEYVDVTETREGKKVVVRYSDLSIEEVGESE